MSDSVESPAAAAAAADDDAIPVSADNDNLIQSSSSSSSHSSDKPEATTTSIAADSVSPVVESSSPMPGSSQQTDSLLTDSENTNNENRVIEMESAANPPSAEESGPDPQPVEEPAASDVKVGEAVEEVKTSESSEKSADKSDDKYAEHVSYDEQGEAIYTDPETKYRYKWSKERNEWVPFDSEHYRWCLESEKWIPKDNPKETEHYRWCEVTNQWLPKVEQSQEEPQIYSNEDGVSHYRDKEGMVHFWDVEKKAWFPKVDDDFMARYQLNYGFTDNTSAGDGDKEGDSSSKVESEKPDQPEEPIDEESLDDAHMKAQGKKRKAPPEPPKWFELKPEHNTKVYVTNLPLDITEEEFGEVMSKCGMVLKDPRTNKLKLKLYRDANGMVKGDGLCHYIKIESVDLALNILDNYDIRGHKIHVQQAEFQLKGEYNPALKPKVRKREKEKIRKMQEALFDWRPEKMRGERSKHERIVIIKNLFEPELFEREVHLLLEYQNDLREECNKCGTCRRVVLFDRHPEGVAQITMSDPEEADLVVKLLNGRFFGKRKLTAAIWDGRTKYRVDETEADVNKRLGNWEKYLEKEEAAVDAEQPTESKQPPAETPQELKCSQEKNDNKSEQQITVAAAAEEVEPEESTPTGEVEQQQQPSNPELSSADADNDDGDESATVETN